MGDSTHSFSAAAGSFSCRLTENTLTPLKNGCQGILIQISDFLQKLWQGKIIL
jgi:hypothetical protein